MINQKKWIRKWLYVHITYPEYHCLGPFLLPFRAYSGKIECVAHASVLQDGHILYDFDADGETMFWGKKWYAELVCEEK